MQIAGDDDDWGICWDFQRSGWQPTWQKPKWEGAGASADFNSSAPMGKGGRSPPPPPPLGAAAPWLPYGDVGVPGMVSLDPQMAMPSWYGMQLPNNVGYQPPMCHDGPFIGDAFIEEPGKGSSWQGAGSGGGWKGGGKSDWNDSAGSAAGGGKAAQQSWSGGGKSQDYRQGGLDVTWTAPAATMDEADAARGRGSGKGVADKGVGAKAGSAGGKGAASRGDKRSQAKGESLGALADEPSGGSAKAKDDVLADIETTLREAGSILQRSDFDSRVRRFLTALRGNGGNGGRQKVRDALAMIHTYTSQKSRDSVTNWPAYLLTLLKRFEPDPFTKGKASGKGKVLAATPGGAAVTPAPVVVPAAPSIVQADVVAPAVVIPTEVVAADLVVPASPAMALPSGWEDGRTPLLEEIQCALLTGSGGGGASLTCPFTGERLDLQATLVSQMAASLESGSEIRRHVSGVARARDLADCPRAAAASAVVGLQELAGLADDSSALDAALATIAARERQGGALPGKGANTVLQEIGLELAAEVLRNVRLQPSVPAVAA